MWDLIVLFFDSLINSTFFSICLFSLFIFLHSYFFFFYKLIFRSCYFQSALFSSFYVNCLLNNFAVRHNFIYFAWFYTALVNSVTNIFFHYSAVNPMNVFCTRTQKKSSSTFQLLCEKNGIFDMRIKLITIRRSKRWHFFWFAENSLA